MNIPDAVEISMLDEMGEILKIATGADGKGIQPRPMTRMKGLPRRRTCRPRQG